MTNTPLPHLLYMSLLSCYRHTHGLETFLGTAGVILSYVILFYGNHADSNYNANILLHKHSLNIIWNKKKLLFVGYH